jgi:predicted dehydrogenase
MARRYGVPRTFARWEEVRAETEPDAVLVLTSGSHAPMARAAR